MPVQPTLTRPTPITALTIASEPEMGIRCNNVMVIQKAAVKVTAKTVTTLKLSGGIIPSPIVFITLPPKNRAPRKAKEAPRKRALFIPKAPLPTVVPMELPISLAAILKAKYKPKRILNERRESIYNIIHHSVYKRVTLKYQMETI